MGEHTHKPVVTLTYMHETDDSSGIQQCAKKVVNWEQDD